MKIQVREDNSIILEGYINVTNRESKVLQEDGKKFVEIIRPNTFERALKKNSNVLMLRDHDFNTQIGDNSTIELREDSIGLHYVANIRDEETVELAKAKKLVGCSFGFANPSYENIVEENGLEKRYIKDLDLYEVSILSDSKRPAYEACSVYTRDNDVNTTIHVRELDIYSPIIETDKEEVEEPEATEVNLNTSDSNSSYVTVENIKTTTVVTEEKEVQRVIVDDYNYASARLSLLKLKS